VSFKIVFLLSLLFVNQAFADNWNYFSIFKNIDYPKKDLSFAKHTDSFIRGLDKKTINKRGLQKIDSFINAKSSFKRYDPLVRQTLNYFRRKDRFSSCPTIILDKREGHDAVEKQWKKSLQTFCRYQLLEKILKRKKLGSYRNLFESSLPYYLRGESLRKFKSFLKQISKNEKVRDSIFSLVSKTIIEEDLPLKEGVIIQLDIGKELTNYIQKNGLNKSKKVRHFLNEFKFLVDAMVENPDDFKNGDDHPVLNFYKYNQKYLPRPKVSKSLLRIGLGHLREKSFEKSNKIFNMAQVITVGEDKKEAIFSLLWPFIIKKDFEGGATFIRKNRMLENFIHLPPKIQFWISYCLHHNKEVILSKGLYKKIIRDFPVNYYAILSLKYLKKIISGVDGKMLFKPLSIDSLRNKLSSQMFNEELTQILKRLIVWLDAGQLDFYQAELDNLLNHKAFSQNGLYKSSLVFNLIGLLNHKEEYLQAFKLAFWSLENNHLKFGTPTLRALFPFAYINSIKSIDDSIDPLIILSLIRQESAFDPWARSSAGARGLMQLMPNTANHVARKRIKKRRLHGATLNLELGINYLKRLLDKYDGNLIYTLAAYNAGESRVRRWKGKYFTSDDPLIMVESIPFKETRKYIKLIYRNIFFYRYLTNDPEISLSIKDSFNISFN